MNFRRLPNKIIDGVEYRYCTSCNEYKPISMFNKNKGMPDGLRSQCKDCDKRYMRAYADRIHKKKEKKHKVDPDSCAACKSYSSSSVDKVRTGWCMALRRQVRGSGSCPKHRRDVKLTYEQEARQISIFPS